MNGLIARFKAHMPLTIEMVITSLFINLLALASPIFVILVLNRYLSSGVTGTLVTLSVGVLIAILFEYCFRVLRMRLASAVSQVENKILYEKVYIVLNHAKFLPLQQIASSWRQEIVAGLEYIQQAYDGNALTNMLDLPFSILFILVLFMLSPWFALVVVCAAVLVLFTSWASRPATKRANKTMNENNMNRATLANAAVFHAETIRCFQGKGTLAKHWAKFTENLQMIRMWLANHQNRVKTLHQSMTTITTVVIFIIGARLIVSGELNVGVLIGANILAARTLSPLIGFAALGPQFVKADQEEAQLQQLFQLSLESPRGTAIRKFTGSVRFADVAFIYQGSRVVLYEALNLDIKPGDFVCFSGENGTGKTTMARLFAGLLEPSRGQILGDGIDLAQFALDWWRQQLMYVPQEVTFMPGTIRSNITSENPNINNDRLNEIIKAVDLKDYLDSTQNGLEAPLGMDVKLSQGIRRRIAFARALGSNGKLVVLDDPMRDLDEKGQEMVYRLIETLKKQCTIIVFTNDDRLRKQANIKVDLNEKPRAKVSN